MKGSFLLILISKKAYWCVVVTGTINVLIFLCGGGFIFDNEYFWKEISLCGQ